MEKLVFVRELHARLIKTNRHTDPSSIFDVIRSYSLRPSHLHTTLFVFDRIERPTLSIWNIVIRCYSQSNRPIFALQLFDEMRDRGLMGNNLTSIYVLKACGRAQDAGFGGKVHALSFKMGFISYLYVCNSLIHMYASCGQLECAKRVFDEMPERDLVSWNSMICGYSQCSRSKDVLRLFDLLRKADLIPDSVTMVKVILACINVGDKSIGEFMAKYIKENNVGMDVYPGNTLIDMYGKHGSMGLAREVFDQMEERNVVSWNAMISGYAKAGDLTEARKLFDQMPKRDVISWTTIITGYSRGDQFSDAVSLFLDMMKTNVKPDEITVASVLSACAHLGSLDMGKAIHDYIRKNNIKEDVYIGNSLIDMYCKCGSTEKALQVFQEMETKDSVSWTSVISGLAVNGNAIYALELFSKMLMDNIQPTHGTFVGILLACAHAGVVDKGLEYFESMKRDYGLQPEMKHYGCVVDLLSRSGNLERAYEFMLQMPIAPDVIIWRMLLGACKLQGNMVLSKIATNRLLEMDPSNSGNYILSSNIFAGAERWDDAMKMRKMLKDGDVVKPSGWSSLQAKS
ncbi:pentatricopeptide repeat-containing protein At2g22410, mitochondrial-like [Cynara cardunculus var. scolymus]|uniref:Pentatricopeptide repeat-containing protein n=1 Tax=Cynara cardunculus var. scolymus TaxID=59895 RepID=A0A103YJA4_CYNCS|nr:pentatricopeptide repeat-containing protein At2g22410, mitochondrial-like [Cynara cardunculus var. scolymus]KVI10139.1 Pentatricopeptide repeat-containing protein [Cynara cardunculus var. scolymus]